MKSEEIKVERSTAQMIVDGKKIDIPIETVTRKYDDGRQDCTIKVPTLGVKSNV